MGTVLFVSPGAPICGALSLLSHTTSAVATRCGDTTTTVALAPWTLMSVAYAPSWDSSAGMSGLSAMWGTDSHTHERPFNDQARQSHR